MLVREILKGKPSDLITITPEHTIGHAAGLLAEKRIGAVVVVDDEGNICGILSERDVARALPKYGESLAHKTVGELCTRNVTTATPQETVNDLMRRMSDQRIRHLPVVDGGKFVGVISIGDVVANRVAELEREQDHLRDYIAGGR